MPTRFRKDPEAVLDFQFDWTAWLADGETITDHTITVPSGITNDSSSVASGVVTVWLSGGTAQTDYRVECLITTSAGRTDERSMTVRVNER